MPVCNVCSGTDFICESGYYFCSECQTQSQDVREEVHENDDAEDEGRVIGGKRRKSAKFFDVVPEDEDASITSWEGFNFALVGLVDELINLGAKPCLKLAVLKLWTSYLSKMEVAFFTKDRLTIPKLGPNFNKSDANIIYGYVKESRKGTKTKHKIPEKDGEENSENPLNESTVDDPLNESIMRKKTLKQKTSAFHQNYERMMNEMSMASQTLTDVTLEMISVSDIDGGERKELQFNSDAKKKQTITGSFQCHPGLLVRNKLICLLYLGLLETHDESITLSDLLRWISEGHLSYCNLSKFFPLETKLHAMNKILLTRYQPSPSYNCLLVATQHLAAYLGIEAIKVPSVKKLIQRFAQELNLPKQIVLIAERLFDMLPKPSEYVPVSLRKALPNWEGRAMAHIIVALKLLLGLDDATEHRNSRIARRFNELLASQNSDVRFFVWDDWERFCVLRRTAFSLLHEPSFVKTNYSTSMVQNVSPLISAWKKSLRITHDEVKRSAVIQDTYKHIAKKLQDSSLNNYEKNKSLMLSFPPSSLPYSSYTEHIIQSFKNGGIESDDSEWSNLIAGLNVEMLSQDFKSSTLSYLTHPERYIEWAQQHGLRIGLHSGSAVSTIKFQEKPEPQVVNAIGNFFRVKVHLEQVDGLSDVKEINPTPTQRLYSLHKPLLFPKEVKKAKKDPLPCVTEMELNQTSTPTTTPNKRGRPKIERKSYDNLPKEEEDNMLHLPHTEYWMLRVTGVASASYAEKVRNLPRSFQLLLGECSSLTEMEPAQLCKEITYIEKLHLDLSEEINSEKSSAAKSVCAGERVSFLKEWYWL